MPGNLLKEGTKTASGVEMLEFVIWTLAIVAGIAILVEAGDSLSNKIVEVAEKAGISPLIISIVLISFATTLPELMTSAMASYSGATGMALGNALGSIFANIALILGLAAVIKPLKADKRAFGNSLVMLASLGLVMLLSADGSLSRLDGAILLASYGVYLTWLLRKGSRPVELESHRGKATVVDYALLIGLGLALVLGAKLVVYGGENIAEALGISDFVIGVTVVAIGTSLPEMTNALYGAVRNRGDISIGNIIGADIMNAFIVLGLAALIHPLKTGASVLTIAFVLAVMIPMIVSLKKEGGLGRSIGVYFLIMYSAYLFLLFSGVKL